jgi:hypothetical protein
MNDQSRDTSPATRPTSALAVLFAVLFETLAESDVLLLHRFDERLERLDRRIQASPGNHVEALEAIREVRVYIRTSIDEFDRP